MGFRQPALLKFTLLLQLNGEMQLLLLRKMSSQLWASEVPGLLGLPLARLQVLADMPLVCTHVSDASFFMPPCSRASLTVVSQLPTCQDGWQHALHALQHDEGNTGSVFCVARWQE